MLIPDQHDMVLDGLHGLLRVVETQNLHDGFVQVSDLCQVREGIGVGGNQKTLLLLIEWAADT